MKKLSFIAFALALFVANWQSADACSDLIVGKKASTDGSVIISYAADSHTLYGELYHWAAQDWARGTMREIRDWDTNKPLGYIPEVAHTYNVVGAINEHQVAITESTWGGREELQNPEGIMDYGSLIHVALQRSRTAREAIEVMTKLVKDYGYYSSGESFSIADKNEVWVMEMIGKGKGKKGAVWVAVRIPDNAISAHANQARIHKIDFKDKANCLYAEDVIDLAREKGYFKGSDKDFDFQQAYNPYTFMGLRACEARVWSFFREFKKDMQDYEDLVKGDIHAKPMPLYIVPDRKVSVADVRKAMRNHFEGTALDMTGDIGAGAYACPYRWRPMTWEVDGEQYFNERAVATQQTGFVLVAQLRSWLPDPIGGVLWFGVDDADMTVFTPMYCSITTIPETYRKGNGDMMHFSWTSAFWIHNWVANMVYNRYAPMIQDLRPVQQKLETSYDMEQESIDRKAFELYKQSPELAIAFLNEYCSDVANGATERWKRLGEYLLVKYMDGNMKKEEKGHFKDNGYGVSDMPQFPGYNKAYYKSIVKSEGERLKLKGKAGH